MEMVWSLEWVGDSGTGGGRTLLFKTGITVDTEHPDQLSDLIKCGFSNLYAKLDYNNDLVVLAEETRYKRDMRVRVCTRIGDGDSG